MKVDYRVPISLNAEYLEDNAKDAAVLKGFREAHLRDMKMLKGGVSACQTSQNALRRQSRRIRIAYALPV